ncbi:CRISPR-associated endonuclease Cas3'' [Streptomyces buecherae]|uniref:CRISPR-associated endonuclease Cas3'' n=1 Tax=Streptomyces buecherae TaxID=2763006 RepID=UPI0037B55A2E
MADGPHRDAHRDTRRDAHGDAHRDTWDATASLRVCVAKTPKYAGGTMSLVATHLLDTAAVAECLWDGFLGPTTRRQLDAAAGGPGRGRTLLAWICGLHDIGKVTPAFQCRFSEYAASLRAAGLTWRPSVHRFPWRHGAAGGFLLKPMLRAAGWPSEHIAWVWPLVAGHHGFLHSADELEPPPEGLGGPQGDERWERARLAHVRYVTEQLGLPSLADAAPATVPSRALQLMVSGLVVMADWIASGGRAFVGIDDFAKVSMAGARERAAAAWSRIGLRGGWGALPTPPPDAFERRFQHPPRPMQRLAMETARDMVAPGLLVIEGPTGEGKTWAGLMATEILAAKFGADGVFVGMPQWSANDPTFARVREWVGRIDPELAPHVALLHGQRNLMPEWSALIGASAEHQRDAVGTCDEDGDAPPQTGPGQTPAEWFFEYERGLWCPFVVSPTDTLLRAMTRTKFAMLRMPGLLSKVILLDEVHAADVSGSLFLLEGLRWFGEAGMPVVLLSATLPAAQRQALADAYLAGAARREEYDHPELVHPDRQPAVTAVWHTPHGPRSLTRTTTPRRPSAPLAVELMPETGPGAGTEAAARAAADAAVADRLGDELADGGCALVIRTTADRAQTLCTEVRHRLPDTPVVLLHEQLTAAQLAHRMAECLRVLRPARAGEAAPPPRPERLIVIASPVAEQSCDLDADLLITDLAPLDLLLQRIGRVHRGDGTPRPARLRTPRVIVTGYAEGDPTRPEAAPPRFPAAAEERYGRHALLLAAAQILRATGPGRPWSYPADVPDLVAAVYGAGADAVPATWRDDWEAARATWEKTLRARTDKAGNHLLTRQGEREAVTLEGAHRLAHRHLDGADGLDDLVRDHTTRRAALLVADGAGHRTVSGTALPAGKPATATCDAVIADTVSLPPTCHDAVYKALSPLRSWAKSPLQHTRVLILSPDGTAVLAGRRLRYEEVSGLVDEGPAG